METLTPSPSSSAFHERWAEYCRPRDELRKKKALERKAIWDEDFREQIKWAIRDQYEDVDTCRGMQKVCSSFLNPLKDITKAVACVYNRGAWRYLDDSSEDEEKALDELYDEGALARQMVLVNRLAFCLGPILVVPRVSPDGRLVRDLVFPHQADVMSAPGDPGGDPIAVRWRLWDVPEGEPCWVEVDQETWRYFDHKGEPVAGPEGRHAVPHMAKDHRGQSVCPATVFRLDDPGDPDWWNAATNDRLQVGTIEAAVKYARWKWVRGFADSKKVHAHYENPQAKPEGQGSLSNPSDAIVSYGDPGRSKLETLDLEVDPENHWSEIHNIVGVLEVAYGLEAGSIRYNTQPGPAANVYISNERKNALVSEQRGPLIRAERRLAIVSASLLGPGRHHLASDLPDPEEFHERYVVEIPEHVAIEDPTQRREEIQWLMKNGIMSRIDVAKPYLPHLTRRQIKERIERNREETADVDDQLRETQTPAEGADLGANPAQLQGRMGGRPPGGSGEETTDEPG